MQVFKHKPTDTYWVSLVELAPCSLAWRAEVHPLKQGARLFTLACNADLGPCCRYIVCLDWSDFLVPLTRPACPLHCQLMKSGAPILA